MQYKSLKTYQRPQKPHQGDQLIHRHSVVVLSFYLSIEFISIYEIYIAPLQGNYSEALPALARIMFGYIAGLA